MFSKVINSVFGGYRNTMILRLPDIQGGQKCLNSWIDCITGKICGNRWTNMYGIAIASNGPIDLDIQRLGSFDHSHLRRIHGKCNGSHD